MLTRDEIHRLIDAVPEKELPAIARAIETTLDPVVRAVLLAPVDDEPLTDEERALVEEARAEAEAVGYLSHDEVKRHHGLA